MLNITDNARQKIIDMAAKQNMEPVVRIGIKSGGCAGFEHSLFIIEKTKIRSTDKEITFDDIIVVVDQKSFQLLGETTIDYKNTLMYTGFDFQSPQYEKQCGCGQSFRIKKE